MKRVAWITDNIYLKHDTGKQHPESIERLISINLKIKTVIDRLIEIKPRFATIEDIAMVHEKSLIKKVKNSSENEIPIVFMLEGGYSVTDLGWNVVTTVKEMFR